jgi:NAD(P)-dependent dehydrogenase (short-subunit alcohol dehydrogenase family)
MGRLTGRTAIVTGGGSGIGRATSAALGREGAAVLVADRDVARAQETCALISDREGRAAPAECDVSDEESVEAMFAVADDFGPVDILVNNAGVGAGGDAVNTTVVEWDHTLGVNLKGVWLCSRAFLRRVLDAKRPGVIVSTSSTNAFYAEPGSAAYTASKGGVSALTRSMALDYARHGVRINCVCPGIIDTPMTQPMLAAEPDPEATRRYWGSLHAIGRMGGAEEIAEAVVFLATDEASFMAGSELVVDGGLSIGTRLYPEEA